MFSISFWVLVSVRAIGRIACLARQIIILIDSSFEIFRADRIQSQNSIGQLIRKKDDNFKTIELEPIIILSVESYR